MGRYTSDFTVPWHTQYCKTQQWNKHVIYRLQPSNNTWTPYLLASLVYNDSIIIYSVSSLYTSYLLHKIFHWWYLSVTYLFLYTPRHRCCYCSCQLFTAKHYNTDWWGAIITCCRYVCMHCWLCSYCHNIAPAILHYSLNAPIAFFINKSSIPWVRTFHKSIPRVHSMSPVHSIPHSTFCILPWTRLNMTPEHLLVLQHIHHSQYYSTANIMLTASTWVK